MKNSVFILCVLLFASSCKGQDKEILIDASKVNSITINNKLSKPTQKLEPKIIITDRKVIDKIVEAFEYSQKIEGPVNLAANNGFFEIDFDEGTVNHYYTINYSVYNGVILRNDHNGNFYKNDRLEGTIYQLFIK